MTVAVGHWERGCEARVLSPRSRLVLVLVSRHLQSQQGARGSAGASARPYGGRQKRHRVQTEGACVLNGRGGGWEVGS